MKFNFEETKIYVRPEATDLRKGVGGLLAVIENEMKLVCTHRQCFSFLQQKSLAPKTDILGQDGILACS